MKIRQLIVPLALACSPFAFAANDGSLSATSSQGDTTVSVTVPEAVQVSVQQDVSLSFTQGSNSTGSTGVCIYHRGTASAGLTLTSGNQDTQSGANPTAFNMDSSGNLLAYTVDISGAETIASLTSGTKASITAATTNSTTCSSSFPHSVNVTVQSTDLDAAPAGSYTDTLTILVEPT